MSRTHRPFKRMALGLLTACFFFTVPAVAYPQSTQLPRSARLHNCERSDLNANFELINGPGGLFTAAFIMRNISDSPCKLGAAAYGVNGSPIFPDNTGQKVFRLSPDSETRVWGRPPFDTLPILAPGKVAYTTMKWNSKPLRESDLCIQTMSIGWPVLVVAPSLLRRHCSDISVSPFTLGDFDRSGNSGHEPWQAHSNEKMKLTAHGEGDSFYLRVSPSSPHKKRLARLMYLRERSSDGTTVFRATFPLSTVKGPLGGVVEYHTAEPPAIDCSSGCYLKPDCYQTVGEHTFQVFQPVHVPKNGPIRFVHSNVVHIRWDESNLPRCRVIVTE